jgi:hypothetical protein
MAAVGEAGSIGIWQDTASLPVGLRDGVVFSAGNFVYVLGGRNDGGPVSTIYYTYIDPDGSLGFGADKHWESNVVPLPEARSSAAWALHDGWIFLIGGKTASGATNTIIRARIYQDGQIGQWYRSPATLPSARWGSSSAIEGERLYIAGGADEHGLTAKMLSFTFGEYGALADRRLEPSVPFALQKGLLAADRDDLILAGGLGNGGWSSKAYRYHDGVWTDALLVAKAEGPFYGQVDGLLIYLRSADAGDSEIGVLKGLSLAPEAPTVIPGSGMVPNNSPVLVHGEPGATLRYRKDGGIPTTGDSIWPDASIKISSATLPSMELSLAAFTSDGTSSPVVHRKYATRSGNLFVVIEQTLQAHDPGYSSLDRRIMQTTVAEGATPKALSSLWYRMQIDAAGSYRLVWADADEDASFSSRLILSVYEADLYTEVPDLNEIPARDRRGGLASPLRFSLGAGDYYLYVRDMDSLTGRTFGLSLLKEE